ncbi:hypothetical protein MTO96_011092 [Rhipicephalus appendiculatus]
MEQITCSIRGCPNEFELSDPSHLLYVCTADDIRCREWLAAIPKLSLSDAAVTRLCVCSLHFERGADVSGDALPTIFPPVPAVKQEPVDIEDGVLQTVTDFSETQHAQIASDPVTAELLGIQNAWSGWQTQWNAFIAAHRIFMIANSHDIAFQMATEGEATETAPTNTVQATRASVGATNLKHHIRTHSGKEEGLLCLVCQQTFPDTDSLQQHSSTHAREKKKYKCSLCPYATDSSKSLSRHKLTHTGILLIANSHDIAFQVATGFTEMQAIEAAPTNTVRPLVPRLAPRPSSQTESDPPSLTLSQKHKTVKRANEEGMLCLVCQQMFPDADSLKQHSLMHAIEKKYKCDLCPYMSASAQNLERHVLTHTGVKKFACSLCANMFPRMDTLKRHINKVHFGYLVLTNSRDIALQVAMGVTEVQATEAAPPVTAQLAPHPLSLTESLKQETVELFSCDLCSFSSIYADDLKNHVRTHSGKEDLLCLVCQQAFPDADSLKQHCSTHSGERKFKCNLCPYAAVSSNNLARHKLTHTDERNFACSVCPHTCTRMDSLRRHINRVHLGILLIADSHDITLQVETGIHRSAGDRGSADQHWQATRASVGTTSSRHDGVREAGDREGVHLQPVFLLLDLCQQPEEPRLHSQWEGRGAVVPRVHAYISRQAQPENSTS